MDSPPPSLLSLGNRQNLVCLLHCAYQWGCLHAAVESGFPLTTWELSSPWDTSFLFPRSLCYLFRALLPVYHVPSGEGFLSGPVKAPLAFKPLVFCVFHAEIQSVLRVPSGLAVPCSRIGSFGQKALALVAFCFQGLCIGNLECACSVGKPAKCCPFSC